MHLKRNKAPKNWPIPKKGTTYIARPDSRIKDSIPIIILIRDLLKIAENRKEVKKAIHEKNIILNDKPVIDEKQGVYLLDKITIVPTKKHYQLILSEQGKFDLEEIKEDKSHEKISKVINKRILKGKKVQLNLWDGKNFLSDIKCDTNDSVIIDFKGKKIKKCVPLKEKTEVLVFAGKHTGKKGTLISLDKKNKVAEINAKEGKIDILIKQIMAVE
ncbi:MAG: hypothetical protein AABW50_00190 [Nanoarchaeota archaeon]